MGICKFQLLFYKPGLRFAKHYIVSTFYCVLYYFFIKCPFAPLQEKKHQARKLGGPRVVLTVASGIIFLLIFLQSNMFRPYRVDCRKTSKKNARCYSRDYSPGVKYDSMVSEGLLVSILVKFNY